MDSWDIFHGDSLEVERGLSTLQVRASLAAGDLRPEDLARPAGTKDWLPIAQIEALRLPTRTKRAESATPEKPENHPQGTTPVHPSDAVAETAPSADSHDLGGADPSDVSFPTISASAVFEGQSPPEIEVTIPELPADSSTRAIPGTDWGWHDDDFDDSDEDISVEDMPEVPLSEFELGEYDINPTIRPGGYRPAPEGPSSAMALPVVSERKSQIALPVVSSRDWADTSIAETDEDEEEEGFTFSRRATEKVEELDLAPMVDVAFQLVLFFMVTATTVLYKSLEVPKPTTDNPPNSVAQGRSKNLDDLRDDFIVVEIDSSGIFKIDREPVAADMDTLVSRLRSAREKTARQRMLLSTEYATPHRFAVLAIDAANDIGLQIAVAKPQGKHAPASAPALFPINTQARPK